MAYISLGYKCNHKCIICPNKKANISVVTPKDQIFKMLDNLKKQNEVSVTISGGEPTIHDTFIDTIQYATRLGIRTNVLSNGDTLSDMAFVEKIEKSVNKELFSITTAFHSHDFKKHDMICKKEKAFERTLKGLHNAINKGLNIQIKHCIHKLNFKQTKEFIDFVYDNFPDFSPLILCGIDFVGLDNTKIDELAISFKELGISLENALDKVIDYHKMGRHKNVFVTETPLCITDPYYWSFFEAKPNTTITYLAPEDNEKEIESDCGTFYKPCVKCGVKDVCQGAWRSTVNILKENNLIPIKISEGR